MKIGLEEGDTCVPYFSAPFCTREGLIPSRHDPSGTRRCLPVRVSCSRDFTPPSLTRPGTPHARPQGANVLHVTDVRQVSTERGQIPLDITSLDERNRPASHPDSPRFYKYSREGTSPSLSVSRGRSRWAQGQGRTPAGKLDSNLSPGPCPGGSVSTGLMATARSRSQPRLGS